MGTGTLERGAPPCGSMDRVRFAHETSRKMCECALLWRESHTQKMLRITNIELRTEVKPEMTLRIIQTEVANEDRKVQKSQRKPGEHKEGR